MANDLTFFQQNDLVIPDFLKDFMSEEANIVPRAGVPSLSYRGRKWTTVVEGEAKVMERRNADGDMEPVGVIRVVVLDYAQKRGRTYYEKDYDSETAKRPDCWTADGVAPDKSVEAPQSVTCAACPMAVKGSKIDAMGRPTTACKAHRMVAVLPAGNLDHPALRLKLAVTSDYDSQSPDLEKEGWFAFRGYLDYLRARSVTRTAAVVTKMKFDPNVDYPKVIFSPDRLITDQPMLAKIKDICASDAIKALINETWTPNGVDGTPTAQEPAPAQRNIQHETKSVGEPFITEDMSAGGKATAKDAKVAAEAAAAKAAKAAATRAANAAAKAKEEADKAAAEAAAKAKALADEDGDDGFGGGKPSSQPSSAPASDVPDDVAALLSEWGN